MLISLPDRSGRVRAMISDFGLCKKLNLGRTSFSRRSGVTGTEGWIAPEMIKGQRTTTSVDIFSLGCVFHYVLSNGSHPFGDILKRQANILSYEYDLRSLHKENTLTHSSVLAEELIRDMIQKDPNRRPTARAILKHPLFWNEERILSFLQDISDRIEKAELMSEPLRTLERNARHVVRDDWSSHLDPEVEADLKKFRGYQGISVRDLLRALRNKKHHYHELAREVQNALGPIPIEFTRYWISRFPHLVSHAYHALECCSKENLFKSYYDEDYSFTKPLYLSKNEFDNHQLMAYYENNKNNAVKNSPKRLKPPNNNNNNSNNANRSPYNGPNTNQQETPTNRRGRYNFKRPEIPEGQTFITREQMGNFNNARQEESHVVWKLPEKKPKENRDPENPNKKNTKKD